MSAPIKGAKGGGLQSHTPVEATDSLHSIAYAQILDLVSEGPIRGFVHDDGAAGFLRDVYFDQTPVANADGSLNFKNVKIDSRSGTQDQLVMAGFADVESETAVNYTLLSTAPWTQSITNLDDSAIRVTLSVPSLQKSDTTTGDIQGYTIQYAIDVQTDGGSFYQVLASSFTGKTTSKYQRSHRIDLPPATTGWTIRVRRLTAEAHLATIQDAMAVDSYAEIVDAKLRYPNSAYVGSIIDSSQFSSIPARAFDLYGRIISVPSNYNPTTRAYTGTWDGTFVQAWTDNPAWIFYDLATNPRYGLGQYVSAALINKWNLYNIAQYCDGMVSNGFGGTEPRMTCSLYLQTQEDAFKVLSDLATVFRGISYWAGGAIQPVANMPGDPVYTYTAANVLGGKFTYQGSSAKTRYTVALVSWNDPADFGKAKVHYVADQEGIARYGVQTVNVTAIGCTSVGQAQRAGLWTLYTSRLETDVVTFKVGLDGTIAAPGQIIAISDPARAGSRQAGRIHAATATIVTLDKAPTVNVGDTLTCTLPTGVTESHAVTAVSGNNVTVASPGFSQVPLAEAVWLLETASLSADLRRVISVAEDGTGTDLSFAISAVQHNASKFAAIDAGLPINVPPVSAIPPSSQPPITGLTLEAFPVANQVLTNTLLIISWNAAANAVYYDVKWRKDNGSWQPLGRQSGLSVDVTHASPGVYQAMVTAVNASGISSIAVISSSYTVADQTTPSAVVATLGTEVATARASAAAALAQLDAIDDDRILSPSEKPTVIRDVNVIQNEQPGLVSQATAYGLTTELDAYQTAFTNLMNYLATLTTPVAWNNLSGNTTLN